jgi:hypothetical protein
LHIEFSSEPNEREAKKTLEKIKRAALAKMITVLEKDTGRRRDSKVPTLGAGSASNEEGRTSNRTSSDVFVLGNRKEIITIRRPPVV